jgi:hypothetical protein
MNGATKDQDDVFISDQRTCPHEGLSDETAKLTDQLSAEFPWVLRFNEPGEFGGKCACKENDEDAESKADDSREHEIDPELLLPDQFYRVEVSAETVLDFTKHI